MTKATLNTLKEYQYLNGTKIILKDSNLEVRVVLTGGKLMIKVGDALEPLKGMTEEGFLKFINSVKDGTGKTKVDKWWKFYTSRDKIILREGNLQHEFKHASDFGITGNLNKSNSDLFYNTLQSHVRNKSNIVYKAKYRGEKRLFYYDSVTVNVVFTDYNNILKGAWKFSQDQINYMKAGGNVN